MDGVCEYMLAAILTPTIDISQSHPYAIDGLPTHVQTNP